MIIPLTEPVLHTRLALTSLSFGLQFGQFRLERFVLSLKPLVCNFELLVLRFFSLVRHLCFVDIVLKLSNLLEEIFF